MQRVLSFPSARGSGDASEFVTKRLCFSFMFSIGFLALLSGFLLGRFALDQELMLTRQNLRQVKQTHQEAFGRSSDVDTSNVTDLSTADFEAQVLENIASLREAADPVEKASFQQAQFLRSQLESFGFDSISPLIAKQISLSYPSPEKRNQVVVADGREQEIFTCNDTRLPIVLSPGVKPLVAESSALVESIPVYINYGRTEDFLYLESLAVEVRGKVVLARAGGIPAEEIVSNAIENDALGILLFLDPQQSDVDPTILTASDLATMQRERGVSFNPNSDAQQKSSVPVLVISASDAERILKDMSGDQPSPDGWRGALKSSYPFGPGFSNTDWKLKLHVNTANIVKTFYNVMAGIRGYQEPDKLVVVANNRDAWLTNVMEIAGAAATLELARVLGELKTNTKWKPHRSIMVVFWGLSHRESDLRPPSESWWTELHRDAAAYLNIDFMPFSSDRVSARLSPILGSTYEKAALLAKIGAPVDIMVQSGRKHDLVQAGMPFLEFQRNGTGTIKTELREGTVKSVTAFWLHLTWNLVDSPALPFRLDSYISFFNLSIHELNQRFEGIARRHALFLDSLNESVKKLINAMEEFQKKWLTAEAVHPVEESRVNNQLVHFVHSLSCHVDGDPMKDLLITRHMIFSRSASGGSPDAGFGVLQDLLREITSAQAPDDLQPRIVTLLSDLVQCLNGATKVLSGRLEVLVLGNT